MGLHLICLSEATPTDKNFMLIQASGGINNQNVLFSLLVARGSSGGINNQNVLFSLLVARVFFYYGDIHMIRVSINRKSYLHRYYKMSWIDIGYLIFYKK